MKLSGGFQKEGESLLFYFKLPHGNHVNQLIFISLYWMGSHFHDWIDYNGVPFSTQLLEWGRIFSGFFPHTPSIGLIIDYMYNA